MKVLVVAGARPNFMKVAPIIAALEARNHQTVLVHTGQHYDDRMSDAFFRDLGLRQPVYQLNVGSDTHARQTARIMEAFEPVLLEVRPAWLVVVGDVNSTLGCALVAVKLKQEIGCNIAHVEAGLRSGDWGMPEEVNRVLTDRISDLLLIPSHDAIGNLAAEGIPSERVVFVGNVMIDSLVARLPAARALDLPGELGLERGGYAVVTLHRPSNVDNARELGIILQGLADLTRTMPVLMPVHPRTAANIQRFGLEHLLQDIRALKPLGYLEMISLTEAAACVLTDSGGLQEETTALGIPCITLREQTERPITLTEGTNRLAAWPPTAEGIQQVFHEAVQRTKQDARVPEGWDGKAGTRIADSLEAFAKLAEPQSDHHLVSR